MPSVTPLERAVYQTLLYFSLFDMPLTALHLWRSLLGTHTAVSLDQVEDCLTTSAWLGEQITSRWGFYTIPNHAASVPARLDRFLIAQHKWRLLKRIARFLAVVPGVSMIAVSGSLALYNTSPASDLDLFVITKPQRIWLTRLLLLIVTHVTGHRRTYRDWQAQAPNLVCLNHYVTETTLTIDPAIRNVYTAMLYTHLVAVTGQDVFDRFQSANQFWLNQYRTLPPALPSVTSLQAVVIPRSVVAFKQAIEGVFSEPFWDSVEALAKWIQLRVIQRHPTGHQPGRIMVSDDELAFHPGHKAAQVVTTFSQLTH